MSFLKPAYEPIYEYFEGNHMLLSIVGSNVILIGVFWLVGGLFLYSDLTGKPAWMSYYKVQPDKNVPMDRKKLKKALKVIAFNNLGLNLLFAYPLYLAQESSGTKFEVDELPTLGRFLYEFIVIALIQEVIFYYSHRLFHHPYFYKKIHKKHHEWTAPIGIIAIYSSPIEYMTGNGMSIFLGPIIMQSHMATVWIWYILANVVTIVHHSGYHLPFLPSPQYHDYHHAKFNWNFGTLGILDWLHGTDTDFWKAQEGKRHRTLWGFTPVWKTEKGT